LERAQIICIAKLGANLLKKVPVVLLALRANLLLQMAFEISGYAVVIKQCVVNVEKENYLRHGDGENLHQHTRLNQKFGLPKWQPNGVCKL
jgi:hypothetical protein